MLTNVTTPQDLDEHLRSRLSCLTTAEDGKRDLHDPIRDGTGLTGEIAWKIFEAQLVSRHLDLAGRWLHDFGAGFYTVASAGHEGTAALAAALRLSDPAMLYPRSGAFYCARAGQVDGCDPARDILRGMVASAADPASGGRHKVFGRADLAVVPVYSAAAGHLPRAVGLAMAVGRGETLTAAEQAGQVPGDDGIVVCTFGDAAVNTGNACSAFASVGWLDRVGCRLPVLFVCEDNGLGTAVKSPAGWVADALRMRPGLRYFSVDGCDPAAVFDTASQAAVWIRRHRRPAVLHMSTVRLMGHDAADDETRYRKPADLAADLDRDPLVATARLLVEAGLAAPAELQIRYDEIGWQVRRVAEDVLGEHRLESVAAIRKPLAPRRPVLVAREIADAGTRVVDPDPAAGPADGDQPSARDEAFGGQLPEHTGRRNLAETINAALTDALLAYPQLLLYGPDVAARGGRNGVTRRLVETFGTRRVMDVALDEVSVLGIALGSALTQTLPVAELPNLAGLSGAGDQLRVEAAMMQFLSAGAYRNPMVLRVPGLAHQPDYGGPLLNENAIAGLRDIPGIVVAVPARASDAAPMLRTCMASALVDGSVCVFVEPAALYATRDLYQQGDGLLLADYAPPDEWAAQHVAIGKAMVYATGDGGDLTIMTFGNGLRLALRAARTLEQDGIRVRVVDLRWLAPLPVIDIITEATATGRVLVVDETRRSGGISEGVLAVLVDAGFVGAAKRIAAMDSFVPLGSPAEQVLVGEEQVLAGARALVEG